MTPYPLTFMDGCKLNRELERSLDDGSCSTLAPTRWPCRVLTSWTEWSIAGRYPADARKADRQDAEQAVRDACAVVDVVAAMFAPAPEGEAAEE